VLYNDFDGQNDPLTAVNLNTAGTQGGVTLNPDGSFTYTPPAGAPLGGAAYLDDTFTYQASDGTNLSAVATVNVRVLPKQTDFKFMMNYELGMHCTGFEFAYCCVLPAYNSIVSQIAKAAVGNPRQELNGAANPCFGGECSPNNQYRNVDYVDAFPRLLEGAPNIGGNLDVLGRETVVRDPAVDATGNFKKYVVKYWHDSQSRNYGQGKPQIANPGLSLPAHLNTKSLISDVEGNTLLSWNTRADAAARNPDGSFVLGDSECDPNNPTLCAAVNVVQGNGDFGDIGNTFGVPVDNYQNAVWNHLYIYQDTEGSNPTGTSLESAKLRLGLDVDYPTNYGPAGHPMGPVSGGVFNDNAFLTFSEDTGTVVFTQMKLVENLPIMLTSPRIWEALGLPLTPFEDTLGFFADPGLVDEDSIRPYVQMSAQLHVANCTGATCTAGAAVLDGAGHPVQGFGDAPIDIPNCERCHSAPPTDAQGNVNVNSPNVIPANEALVELEYNFWAAYYDLDVGAGDSDWYARLKGAAISILGTHDVQHGTQFLANYPAAAPVPAGTPFNPVTQLGGLSEPFTGAPAHCLVNKKPTGPACSTHAQCVGIGDQVCDLPQNTRIGHDSVICQKCHADNVIAVVKSTNCGSATSCAEGGLIPALSQALHHNHRGQSEGGDIVFDDALGRSGGCQGCHPAHRSDGVMDGYPIDLDGNNFLATGDNRLAQGGCFVGRDVHSNPLKDVDGAETPEHLTALGQYLSDWVFRNQSQEPGGTEDIRGIWCTNCHSQAAQQIWKAENCTDLVNNNCAPGENPRAAATMQDLADMIVTRQPNAALRLAQLESWADPKNPAIDPDLPLSGPGTRSADDTHFIWNTENFAEGGTGLCNYVAQWAAAGFNLSQISAQYDGAVALVEVAVPALGGSAAQCQTGGALSTAPVGGTPVALCDGAPGIPPGGFFLCGSYDGDGDFTAALTAGPGESPFCTTQDCKAAADATLAGGGTLGNVTAQIPFSSSDITTASDGRDHWLSAGEPHCADCHKAPYTEQSGNVNAFPPFNYPRKASLMRYSRGHQDITCQGCHESIHGLYPVTPTIDNTTYAQAAGLNADGSHGPLKCASCHTHVNADQVPVWVDGLSYTDPVNGGPAVPVVNNFDAAVSWAHTYTEEADPNASVCLNCHGDNSAAIGNRNEEWQIHAMINRVSRVAMDNAELQAGAVSSVPNPASPYGTQATDTVCRGCHGNEGTNSINNCTNVWKRHLTEGRVSEAVWEEVTLAVTDAATPGPNNGNTCGW
jgi:VCBS repeat-containing protein